MAAMGIPEVSWCRSNKCNDDDHQLPTKIRRYRGSFTGTSYYSMYFHVTIIVWLWSNSGTHGYRPLPRNARTTLWLDESLRGGAQSSDASYREAKNTKRNTGLLSSPFLDSFQHEVHELVAEYRSQVRDTFQKLRQDIELMDDTIDFDIEDEYDLEDTYDIHEEPPKQQQQPSPDSEDVQENSEADEETELTKSEDESRSRSKRRSRRSEAPRDGEGARRSEQGQSKQEQIEKDDEPDRMSAGEVMDLDDAPSERSSRQQRQEKEEKIIEEMQQEYLEDLDDTLSNAVLRKSPTLDTSLPHSHSVPILPEEDSKSVSKEKEPDTLIGFLIPSAETLRNAQIQVLRSASLVFTVAVLYIMITVVLRFLQITVLKR